MSSASREKKEDLMAFAARRRSEVEMFLEWERVSIVRMWSKGMIWETLSNPPVDVL